MPVTRSMAKGRVQQLPIDEGRGRKRRNCSKKEPPFVLDDQALMNDVVLSTLFGYFEGKDLKSCRLVCKKWNIHTLSFVRSRFRVFIQGIVADNWQKPRGIGTFVKLMETNTLGIPFEKFSLCAFDTNQGVGQKFLKLCGKTIKKISFYYGDVFMIEDISMLLGSVPNLQSVTLPSELSAKDSKIVELFPGTMKPKLTFLNSINVDLSVPQTEKCPTFYEELFEVAENISSLDLSSFSSELTLKILEIIGKSGRKTRIQKLILEDITSKHLKVLQEMARRGLILKQLDCGSRGFDPTNVVWSQLIKCFKNNLISLKLDGCFLNSTRLVIFERMPKLKELHLRANIPINLYPGSQNFNIFPNLEKLNLSLIRDATEFYNFFSGKEDCPSPTMTSLHIPTIPMKMENLNRILTIFPNLKAFKCEIREGEVMRKIWTHMPQLEDLNISGTQNPSENVDSFFTGIPVEEMGRMGRDMKNFLDSLEQQNVDIRREQILLETNKYCEFPSIRNLTSLRSLKRNFFTKYSEIEESNSLTDVTGYLGLYSLKNLGHLWVYASDISRTCADVLAKDMGLQTWKFYLNYTTESHPNRGVIQPSVYIIQSE